MRIYSYHQLISQEKTMNSNAHVKFLISQNTEISQNSSTIFNGTDAFSLMQLIPPLKIPRPLEYKSIQSFYSRLSF